MRRRRSRAAGEAVGSGLDAELDRFVSERPPLTPTFVSRFLQQLRVAGRRHARDPPAGAMDRGGGARRRGGRGPGHPAPGAHPGRHGEQHHQPPRHRPDGLEDVRRAARAASRRCCGRIRQASTPRMTFATRDGYRHVVERIAQAHPAVRAGGGPARDRPVARRVPPGRREDPRLAHVGYYLIDDGLAELERATGYRPRRRATPCSAGCGATRTWCSSAACCRLPRRRSRRSCGWAGPPLGAEWVVVLLLALIPANDIAVNVDQPAGHGLPAAPHAPQARPPRARRASPSSARRSWSRRCSAAWTRCAKRWRTSRCSSWPTVKRTSTSRC